MKNVRVWFKKTGPAIYISHLDLNRCMLRAIQKSKIPVWRTEGFNPHPYITFSLPLSLGFAGECESMDIRLAEEMSFEMLKEAFNRSLPQGIEVIEVSEPQMKPNQIACARFLIEFENGAPTVKEIEDFFSRDEILVEKKTKKGTKLLNLSEHIKDLEVFEKNNTVSISLLLPAGNAININPNLYIAALSENAGKELFVKVIRTDILTEDLSKFK